MTRAKPREGVVTDNPGGRDPLAKENKTNKTAAIAKKDGRVRMKRAAGREGVVTHDPGSRPPFLSSQGRGPKQTNNKKTPEIAKIGGNLPFQKCEFRPNEAAAAAVWYRLSFYRLRDRAEREGTGRGGG